MCVRDREVYREGRLAHLLESKMWSGFSEGQFALFIDLTMRTGLAIRLFGGHFIK